MKRITISIILLIFILTGCAFKQYMPLTTTKEGVIPPINVKTKKYVGDIIFEQFKYKKNEVVYLENNYNKSYVLGKINISNAEPLLGYSNGTEKQYCSTRKAYIDPLIGPYDIVCFGGIDEINKYFTKVRVPSIMLGAWKNLEKPVKFNKSKIYTDIGTSGFKYQLIYDGVDNDTIKITYREFINNMARPAYYQSVSYTINAKKLPQKIRFKSVEIIIYDFNNQYIEYKITSPFRI